MFFSGFEIISASSEALWGDSCNFSLFGLTSASLSESVSHSESLNFLSSACVRKGETRSSCDYTVLADDEVPC